MLMNRSHGSRSHDAGSRRTAPHGRFAALALLVPLALTAAGGIAHASDTTRINAATTDAIDIKMDRAKVMRVSRPAATVVVGNPAIADATIQDRQTLIITGRSFGTTNLIVLDEAGEPIADELLTVTAADDQMITIYAGSDRRSFSCAPDCQPVMKLGDTTAAFADVQKQLTGRNAVLQGATSQPNAN